jgi:zinc transporter ZupT
MNLKLFVLFLTPLLSGLAVYLVPKGKNTNFRLLLAFAGSYLFAITVVHILPELYRQTISVEWIGLFVLIGFYLQQFLEYFTSGVEHGHIHAHDHSHDHSGHTHKPLSAIVLLVALCVHAFLEGGMLAQPSRMGLRYDLDSVLIGIVLHRAPAAFALMTVLAIQFGAIRKAIPYLLGFSIAAPVGLLASQYLTEVGVISPTGTILLHALVSGNFLHISTTIVFESSPEHHFNAKKMAVVLIGALVAVAAQHLI